MAGSPVCVRGHSQVHVPVHVPRRQQGPRRVQGDGVGRRLQADVLGGVADPGGCGGLLGRGLRGEDPLSLPLPVPPARARPSPLTSSSSAAAAMLLREPRARARRPAKPRLHNYASLQLNNVITRSSPLPSFAYRRFICVAPPPRPAQARCTIQPPAQFHARLLSCPPHRGGAELQRGGGNGGAAAPHGLWDAASCRLGLQEVKDETQAHSWGVSTWAFSPRPCEETTGTVQREHNAHPRLPGLLSTHPWLRGEMPWKPC